MKGWSWSSGAAAKMFKEWDLKNVCPLLPERSWDLKRLIRSVSAQRWKFLITKFSGNRALWKKTDGEHYQEPSCIFSYFKNFCKNTKKDKQPIWATPLIALSHLVWLPLVQPAVEITFKALLPNPLTFKPDHNKQLRLMIPCLISEVR